MRPHFPSASKCGYLTDIGLPGVILAWKTTLEFWQNSRRRSGKVSSLWVLSSDNSVNRQTVTETWSDTHGLSVDFSSDEKSTSIRTLLVDIALTDNTCVSTVRPPPLMCFVNTSLNERRKRNDVWRFFGSPPTPPDTHIRTIIIIIIINNIVVSLYYQGPG